MITYAILAVILLVFIAIAVHYFRLWRTWAQRKLELKDMRPTVDKIKVVIIDNDLSAVLAFVRKLSQRSANPYNLVFHCYYLGTLAHDPELLKQNFRAARKWDYASQNLQIELFDNCTTFAEAWNHSLCNKRTPSTFYLLLDVRPESVIKQWDVKLINDFDRLPLNTSVLTGKVHVTPSFLSLGFRGEKVSIFARPFKFAPKSPVEGAFLSASLMFGYADELQQVAVDPHYTRAIAELVHGIRLFTHGFNLYYPTFGLLEEFNMLANSPDSEEDLDSNQRLAFFVGNRPQETMHPSIIGSVKSFPVGTTHGIADYERFAGVQFVDFSVSRRGFMGVLSEKSKKEIIMKYGTMYEYKNSKE